jgi:hypothetical protein
MMTWASHKRLCLDGRLLWFVIAHALVLIVVLAQPVASLAWLGGAHVTIEQAAFHEEAVEHGHYHHGAPQHHEHQPSGGAGKTDVQFSRTALEPVLASAETYAGPFQELLQATLTIPADAPSPDNPPRCALLAQVVLCQHSPPVPHRPPIFSCPSPSCRSRGLTPQPGSGAVARRGRAC